MIEIMTEPQPESRPALSAIFHPAAEDLKEKMKMKLLMMSVYLEMNYVF
jgi:hypothetical protein